MRTKALTYRKVIALVMAVLMCAMSIPMLSLSVFAADGDAVSIVKEDGSIHGSYASIKAAHDEAVKQKLNNYTLKLLADITTDSETKLNSSLASKWTLDGNGKTVTQTAANKNAFHFSGNADSEVTIKNLTVVSTQCAIYFDSGNYKILSGTYTITDPADWATGVIICGPKDLQTGAEKTLTCTIYGGGFFARYYTYDEIKEDLNRIQAVVLNKGTGVVKSTLNIYGGYFLSESKMTKKGVVNDSVINTLADSGDAITNIYGGTFEAKNAGFVIVSNYFGEVNVYNGIFLADVYNYRSATEDDTPVVNPTGVINLNTASKSKMNFTYGIFSGGGSLFRNKGTINDGAENVRLTYMTPATAPTPNLEAVNFDGKSYAPKMTTGVAMLLGAEKGGLKYETKVSAATIANIQAMADEGTELSYGTVITDADLRYITVDALVASGKSYANITANASKELDLDGNLTFSGALINIKDEYLNTKFTAIPYVEATVNGAKVRFYGVYNGEDNCMSVSDVAAAAVADVKDAADDGYANLLDTGKYSKYTQEEVDKLETFIKE